MVIVQSHFLSKPGTDFFFLLSHRFATGVTWGKEAAGNQPDLPQVLK